MTQMHNPLSIGMKVINYCDTEMAISNLLLQLSYCAMGSMPSFKSKLNAILDSWLVPARDDNKCTIKGRPPKDGTDLIRPFFFLLLLISGSFAC